MSKSEFEQFWEEEFERPSRFLDVEQTKIALEFIKKKRENPHYLANSQELDLIEYNLKEVIDLMTTEGDEH